MVDTVAEIGAEVAKHEVGENPIPAWTAPATITQGGDSTHVVVEDFVLKIPDAIPFEAAELVRAAAGGSVMQSR